MMPFEEKMIANELAHHKQKQKHRYRRGIRTKKEKSDKQHRLVSQARRPPPVIEPEVPVPQTGIERRRSLVSQQPTVSDVQSEMEALRHKWLERAVHADALDPSVLDGEITLPTEVMELLEKENFSKEDMQRCALAIGRDNMGQLAALCRNKDPRVQLEAFRLLYQFVYGDAAKKVEHSGPNGEPQQIILRLVAPNGRETEVERPKLLPGSGS
jgi:hypothetical protein